MPTSKRPAPGQYHALAHGKMAAVLGEHRARDLVVALTTKHSLALETPDDLARFATELSKLGGFEGAVGAMLGLQATMLGGRRPEVAVAHRTLATDSPAALLVEAERALQGCRSVEDAAQRTVTLLAQRYPTVVLARCYVIARFQQLGPFEATFAQKLASEDRRTDRLRPDTPVLVLLGSNGVEPAWRDRRQSRKHLAIPLLDTGFLRTVPMIGSMLAELDVDLTGFDSPGAVVRRLTGTLDGTFYVRDARDALDAKGARLIPGAEFVRTHDVRTVFALGGHLERTLAVTVLFTRELLEREAVTPLKPLMGIFNAHTRTLLRDGKLFAAALG
ncbi:MAG: hypothetical protein H0V89_08125 [Deltaproteobacteria bacterium]|nr:hypothetical protein [Deltaproteobacteria bacterium]